MALTKKGVRFSWSPEAQKAFERLKRALAETVTLAYPQPEQTTVILRTDHYSLKWLRTFKRPEGILARWIETLAEVDYTHLH